MKKLFLFSLILLVSVSLFAQFQVPKRTSTYVHDYEKVLSPAEHRDLSLKLFQFEQKSGVEFAVVILSDLGGEDVDDVAFKIGREWGVGKKELNNGIVYLWSPKERKTSIQVGYGLEGDLPDITTKEIQVGAREFYRNKEWANGLNHVTNEIIKILDPEAKEMRRQLELKRAEESKQAILNMQAKLPEFGLIIAIVISIVWLFINRKKRLREKELEEQKKRQLEQQKKHDEASRVSSFNMLMSEKAKISGLIKGLTSRLSAIRELCSNYNIDYDALERSFTIHIRHLNVLHSQLNALSKDANHKIINNLWSKLQETKNELQTLVRTAEDTINERGKRETIVKSFINNTGRLLYHKASANIKNTTYTSLKKDKYDTVINEQTMLWNHYPAVMELTTHFNNIINFQENERKRIAQEKEAQARRVREEKEEEERRERRKRQQEEEDDDRRRRTSSSSSSSFYSSSDISSSSSSSSSDYGGGSFGGGGSSDSY